MSGIAVVAPHLRSSPKAFVLAMMPTAELARGNRAVRSGGGLRMVLNPHFPGSGAPKKLLVTEGLDLALTQIRDRVLRLA